MHTIIIPAREIWDDKQQIFFWTKEERITIEHSLLSISKWESKWHKPFFQSLNKMTNAEFIDYVRCMTINKNVDDRVFLLINQSISDEIFEYLNNPMTASIINERSNRRGIKNEKFITSELIYCWMTQFNIPFECEKWHFNRLMMLIRICSAENSQPEKMSRRETLNRYAALNKARKAKRGTRG